MIITTWCNIKVKLPLPGNVVVCASCSYDYGILINTRAAFWSQSAAFTYELQVQGKEAAEETPTGAGHFGSLFFPGWHDPQKHMRFHFFLSFPLVFFQMFHFKEATLH